MTEGKTIQGNNYTCFQAGPMVGWSAFRLEPPAVPRATSGKVFLQSLLGSTGLEVSLNAVPPGRSIPFLHRHQENDEVYVVVGGQGQFLVDGTCIDVEEGSVVRLGPTVVRAWRNNSAAPFYFLCLQYRADSVTQGGTADGQKVDGIPHWPS